LVIINHTSHETIPILASRESQEEQHCFSKAPEIGLVIKNIIIADKAEKLHTHNSINKKKEQKKATNIDDAF
jgi:hypothetical protein